MSTIEALRNTWAAERLALDDHTLCNIADAIDEYLYEVPQPIDRYTLHPIESGTWVRMRSMSQRNRCQRLKTVEASARKLAEKLPTFSEDYECAQVFAALYKACRGSKGNWRSAARELEQLRSNLENVANAASMAREDEGKIENRGRRPSPETFLIHDLRGSLQLFLDAANYPPDAEEWSANHLAATIYELVTAVIDDLPDALDRDRIAQTLREARKK